MTTRPPVRAKGPSHAERARTIVAAANQGSLATLAKRPAGYPFGSIVLYALAGGGRPVFALSDLAEHSKNLALDPRASLLVTEPPDAGDALASGRVTLVGSIRTLAGADRDSARDLYLGVHPHSYYVDFDDFKMYELEIEAVRYVGGFGMMSWVDADRYAAAEPDPIAPAAGGIISHMNDDHADAVRLYAEVLAGVNGVVDATMSAVDRYGFEIVVRTAEAPSVVRLSYDEPLTEPGQVRGEMIALLARARKAGATDAV